MQSLSKYNKGIKYLLCGIDLFSKYAWVFPLKDKRGISNVNAFQKIISGRRKLNKISHPAFTCSNLTIELQEHGLKNV